MLHAELIMLAIYARSPQWYHERPNRPFTSLEKWCFQYIPLWLRYQRLRLFVENDNLVATYKPGPTATKAREKAEASAKEYIYIYRMRPEKYHGFIVPIFPLGETISVWHVLRFDDIEPYL